MGDLSFILCMEVNRTPDVLYLTQARYASDLLSKFNMASCKPCPTPLPIGSRLSSFEGEPLFDVTNFRSMVGRLQYLTLSRPNIAFVVHQVCQFMHALTHLIFMQSNKYIVILRARSPLVYPYVLPRTIHF